MKNHLKIFQTIRKINNYGNKGIHSTHVRTMKHDQLKIIPLSI